MKKCTHVVVCAVMLCQSNASLGDVIFSNFGPGDSYNTSQSYPVTEGEPFGGNDFDQGEAFTVFNGDFFLNSINLAMSLSVGQNTVFIDVYDTVDGLPGEIVDSAVIHGQMQGPGANGPPITATFDGSTILQGGHQYFVTASADTDSLLTWSLNDQDHDGLHVRRINLGDWTEFDTPASAAYRINGTLVPAPGALALLGMAGMAIRRRRRTN